MLAAGYVYAAIGGGLCGGGPGVLAGLLGGAGAGVGAYLVGCVGRECVSLRAAAAAGALVGALAVAAGVTSAAPGVLAAIAGAWATRAHSDGKWSVLDGGSRCCRISIIQLGFVVAVVVALVSGDTVHVRSAGGATGFTSEGGPQAGGGGGSSRSDGRWSYDFFRGSFSRSFEDWRDAWLSDDPHAVLDVARGASFEEVRRAYRGAALKWHPDKHAGSAAEQTAATREFLRVQKAYESLCAGHPECKSHHHGGGGEPTPTPAPTASPAASRAPRGAGGGGGANRGGRRGDL